MTPPAAVRAEVEAVLGASIASARRVSGGCISPAARVSTAGGDTCFLKWSDDGETAMFAAEARGLAALRSAGAVRVPAVVGQGRSWLLLEWLEPGAPGPGTWSDLGAGLAALHAMGASAFGADDDNFIGPLPQSNRRRSSWIDFWRDERLAPQFELARSRLDPADAGRLERFMADALDPLLAAGDEDGPSLLHGDLWGGNVHVLEGGRAALIDPSAYWGHGEVDLAMASMFGGFDAAFFRAYEAVRPPAPGWRERRAAYQLYYLLVHVNLFGSGYVAQTLAALRAAGG